MKSEEKISDLIPLTKSRLYSKKTQNFLLIIGIGAIVFGIVDFILMGSGIISSQKSIMGIDIISFMGFYLILAGISLLFNSGTFFRQMNPYVKFTNESVEIKSSTFAKVHTLSWNQIDSIEIKSLGVLIFLKNGQKSKFDLDWAPYNSVILLKEKIIEYSKQNSILLKN